jgi:hypothetical protein
MMRALGQVLLACLLVTTAFAAETSTVVQVRHQPAAALVPAIRPLLGENGGVSAFHDKLILRGEPAAVEAAQAALAELDRPARRLLIEVSERSHFGADDRQLVYGARTDQLRFGTPPPPGQRAQIGFREAHTRASGDGVQRVQALDGRPALIMAGQSVPVYRGYQGQVGNTVYQGFDMSYRDADRGFVALPRVHGDQVTVEIHQRNDQPAMGGRFNTQRASTVLRGRLGEWLTLGSIGGQHRDNDGGLGLHASTRRSEDRQLRLRVIALDR